MVWQDVQSIADFPWGLAKYLPVVFEWQVRHLFDLSLANSSAP
jgi:hypothetical protein